RLELVPDGVALRRVEFASSRLEEPVTLSTAPLDEVVPLVLDRLRVPDLLRVGLRRAGGPAHDDRVEVAVLQDLRVDRPIDDANVAGDADLGALVLDVGGDPLGHLAA